MKRVEVVINEIKIALPTPERIEGHALGIDIPARTTVMRGPMKGFLLLEDRYLETT